MYVATTPPSVLKNSLKKFTRVDVIKLEKTGLFLWVCADYLSFRHQRACDGKCSFQQYKCCKPEYMDFLIIVEVLMYSDISSLSFIICNYVTSLWYSRTAYHVWIASDKRNFGKLQLRKALGHCTSLYNLDHIGKGTWIKTKKPLSKKKLAGKSPPVFKRRAHLWHFDSTDMQVSKTE